MNMECTDQALVHLVQNPRTWTHWKESVVPAVFIQFQGYAERIDGKRAPLFRVFAVRENHQPAHLEVPKTPGNISTDLWEFADQLSVPGPRGSKVRPMVYLIHPTDTAWVLSMDQEDILGMAESPDQTMAGLVSCPMWGHWG